MTLPEALDLQFQISSMSFESQTDHKILQKEEKSGFLSWDLNPESSMLSQNSNLLPAANLFEEFEFDIQQYVVNDEPLKGYADQLLSQDLEIEDEYRPHLELEDEKSNQIQENFSLHERDDMLLESYLAINSENKTSKYKGFKGSKSQTMRYGTQETDFIKHLLSSVLRMNGQSDQGVIEDVNCSLRSDFSYELQFYIRMRSGENVPQNFTTSTFDGVDLFKNLVSNITDYFLTSTFMKDHNVSAETREALAEFNQTPGGANRMKDADVEKLWKVIADDHVLVTAYFEQMNDDCLHEYLANTFQRTRDALNKAMRPIRRLEDLEFAKLDENLSTSLRSMFFKYVKNVVIPENMNISDELKLEIAETVTVAYESFQTIWLFGFRESIQSQVLNFIKQRICKLHEHGVKENAKKSKSKKSKSQKKVKLSNE